MHSFAKSPLCLVIRRNHVPRFLSNDVVFKISVVRDAWLTRRKDFEEFKNEKGASVQQFVKLFSSRADLVFSRSSLCLRREAPPAATFDAFTKGISTRLQAHDETGSAGASLLKIRATNSTQMDVNWRRAAHNLTATMEMATIKWSAHLSSSLPRFFFSVIKLF